MVTRGGEFPTASQLDKCQLCSLCRFQHGRGGAGHGLGEATRVCWAGPSLTHVKGGGPSLELVSQGPLPHRAILRPGTAPYQTGHHHLLVELIKGLTSHLHHILE